MLQRQNVMWLGSKLDQYTRAPYACFLPILDQLVDRMLSLPPEVLSRFREVMKFIMISVNGRAKVFLLLGCQRGVRGIRAVASQLLSRVARSDRRPKARSRAQSERRTQSLSPSIEGFLLPCVLEGFIFCL